MPTTPSKKPKNQRDTDDVVRDILDRPSPVAPPAAGHSSLEHATVRATARRDPSNRIIALELIDPDPDQPRTVIENSEEFDGLVSSIREHGVISPIYGAIHLGEQPLSGSSPASAGIVQLRDSTCVRSQLASARSTSPPRRSNSWWRTCREKT